MKIFQQKNWESSVSINKAAHSWTSFLPAYKFTTMPSANALLAIIRFRSRDRINHSYFARKVSFYKQQVAFALLIVWIDSLFERRVALKFALNELVKNKLEPRI